MFARVVRSSVAAVALVAGGTIVAEAQFLTDAGSPLGGGGGASGSVVNYVGGGGLSNARFNFLSAFGRSGNGNAPNPATGGSVSVPQAIADAIRAAADGTPGAANGLAAALGGSAQAGAAANAFAAFVSSPTPASLIAAITAYNALVEAAPEGDAGVLALREAIRVLGMLR